MSFLCRLKSLGKLLLNQRLVALLTHYFRLIVIICGGISFGTISLSQANLACYFLSACSASFMPNLLY